MTDNSTLPVSVGTEVFANDDIGPGVKYPRVKMVWGVDGTAVDASATNPVPIGDAGGSLTVDGTVAVSGVGGTVAVSGTVTANAGTGTMAVSGTVTANAGTGTFTTSGAITAIVPGTAATNLGKAIDSAVGSTDTGIGALVKRVDTLTTLTPAAADWTPLQVDSTGALWVRIIDSQVEGSEYVSVGAGATDTVIQIATGATGDYLSHVTVFPGAAACGVVTIKDGTTVWGTFPGGGTTALPTLVPFNIPVGVNSKNGSWKITTGANVTCNAIGNFS